MSSATEFAHLWTPCFDGLELFQAQLRRHAFDKHFHDAYTIGLNERGLGRIWFQGTLIDSPPGSLNLINPGEVHTGKVADERGWSFRNLYISQPLMQSLLKQLEWEKPELPCFQGPVVPVASLRPLFLRVFQTLNQPASRLTQQSFLVELLSHLWRQHGDWQASRSTASESKSVTTVRTYLEEHSADNISIETLCQLTGLSGYYLIHCFCQQMGLPPHRYQRQVRLLKAKQALYSPQPLSKIAVEAGFYDQSHFTRSFKRVFGLTPGQYRQDRHSNFVQDR